MRRFTHRYVVAVLTALAVAAAARAADPVTVELAGTATVGKSVVTVGDVALVSGGDADARARVARIDLAELKARDPGVTVGRRAVEYRLVLAGFEPAAVRVTGAERAAVTVARRAVTLEEVTAAARAEVLRPFTNPAEAVAVELAVPVVVKLPDVPADERAVITARPRGRPGATGRVQVDMAVAVGGETLLSFAVHLEVRPVGRPGAAVVPAGGVVPPVPLVAAGGTQFASAELLIRPRQRVEMRVTSGGLTVTATGEAQQAGKLGQIILVQNVDSKKTVSARVTGPGTVEVDLGGAP